MPIDLWGSLPSDDTGPTPREQREAEARRRAFDESTLLPKPKGERLCVTCGLRPRNRARVECGFCIGDEVLRGQLARCGADGVVVTKGTRRDTAARLVANGEARWATMQERQREARRRRLIDGATLVFPVTT